MANETLYKVTVQPGAAGQRETVQVVELAQGVRIGFRFRWSKATSAWYGWVLDLDLTQIAGPFKLVPGVDLLQPFKHDARVPQGQLFINSPTRSAPTLTTIDSEALLLYRRP